MRLRRWRGGFGRALEMGVGSGVDDIGRSGV